ncbi:MAG: GAF domain-containing sensor histidine kinase [Chloroflexi bacterium]|nr:GAF domain-containing sensor histidine kinase [Chloroflexota bacterium]
MPKASSRTHAEDKATTLSNLEQRIAALEALQEVALTFSSELGLNRLLALILSSAVDVMRASAGSLLLYDPAQKELVFQVVQGGSGKVLRNKRIKSDEGIAGWVFSRKRPVIVHDAAIDPRFLNRIDRNFKFRTTAMVAAPLIYKNRCIGVIEIINKKSGEKFNPDDQDLLLAFAGQSAVLIENARLYQQVVAERDRLLAVEEEVRHELARELHDGPSQLLSAVIMGLRFLKQVIEREPARAEAELAELERLSTQALHQVRNMLFDLRPVALETQGICAAIQIYVERQSGDTNLKLQLDTDASKIRFEPKVEGAAFSIIQEAVGNAKKHAHAETVTIAVKKSSESLTLSVRDDGRGFDVVSVEEAYAQRGNLGLLNMKERAELCHGKLTIDSEPGKGTTVTLVLPLNEPRRSARLF